MGDEYRGGIVAIADPVSGELVIVPDAEALDTITGNTYNWAAAIAFAESYTDGVNSDYRLITKAEALAILRNYDLLSQLGLSGLDNFWTIEEIDLENAHVFAGSPNTVYPDVKTVLHGALPIRKVNFYGLPLIDSEFGGGLVYDVVAATRTVEIVAKWEDIYQAGFPNPESWENVYAIPPIEIPGGGEIFTHIQTRAQALKIFGNSYLVALAGLTLDNDYWTSEEADQAHAYAYINMTEAIEELPKTDLFYVLPVRSEVVPET